MKPTVCQCCGGPLQPTDDLECWSCAKLAANDEPPDHPQSEWKQEVQNDDEVLRRVDP